jgi:hypothetical protein
LFPAGYVALVDTPAGAEPELDAEIEAPSLPPPVSAAPVDPAEQEAEHALGVNESIVGVALYECATCPSF